MDLEKYREYAKSKIKTDKMRKEIKETLDEYKTAQRVGYEKAKTQFKPLLEAQAAQTKAQEAQAAVQTAAMKQIIPFKKPEEFSKGVQEFIKKYNFPAPSLLLAQGIFAYNNGKEEIWKNQLLNLSLEITKLIEITDDPAIKKAASEYKKSLQKVVTTVVTPQKQKQGFTTPPEALSPATSTERLTEVDPRQAAAEKNFDYPLETQTLTYLEENNLLFPSIIYLAGINAEAAGSDKYYKWRKDLNILIRDLEISKEAAIDNEKKILNNYNIQLKKIWALLPGIPVLESDENKDFTETELDFLKKEALSTPEEVLDAGIKAKLKSSEAYKAWDAQIDNKIKALKKKIKKKMP